MGRPEESIMRIRTWDHGINTCAFVATCLLMLTGRASRQTMKMMIEDGQYG